MIIDKPNTLKSSGHKILEIKSEKAAYTRCPETRGANTQHWNLHHIIWIDFAYDFFDLGFRFPIN